MVVAPCQCALSRPLLGTFYRTLLAFGEDVAAARLALNALRRQQSSSEYQTNGLDRRALFDCMVRCPNVAKVQALVSHHVDGPPQTIATLPACTESRRSPTICCRASAFFGACKRTACSTRGLLHACPCIPTMIIGARNVWREHAPPITLDYKRDCHNSARGVFRTLGALARLGVSCRQVGCLAISQSRLHHHQRHRHTFTSPHLPCSSLDSAVNCRRHRLILIANSFSVPIAPPSHLARMRSIQVWHPHRCEMDLPGRRITCAGLHSHMDVETALCHEPPSRAVCSKRDRRCHSRLLRARALSTSPDHHSCSTPRWEVCRG